MPNMRTIFILSILQFSVSYMFDNNAVNTGFFWHITDIHVDQNYSRTGNPRNLCHKETVFYPDNGFYGNFLCDSPESLVNVTFKAMKKIKPNPDFIIWTGDNLPHTKSFDPDWNIIYKALHNVTVLLDENFHGIPTFPCIGNHDTFPPNVLLPNETSNSVYKSILEKGGWIKFLNDESASTFIKGGYYSQVLRPGLRIISLNTILWYMPNYLTQKLIDPADQLKWFEGTLYNSSKTSEKVYIIGHVPPGFYNRAKHGTKSSPTYHFQYLNAYLKILKKYTTIVAAQLFGHLHMDMFQIFSLGSGQFLSSSLLASSVTPWHFESKDNVSIPVNPSVRLMHYDQRNWLLKDYDQFYLNLTKANELNVEESDNLYELLYTFTKSYNVPDLSTESLVEVYENIKRNDTLFDMFFKFSTAGKESVICDTYCKVAQICSISSTSVEEYNSCMKNSEHLNFNCHDSSGNPNIYSNIFAYCIAFAISCLSVFLLFFVCQRYKQSRGEIYTKLLRDI